MSIHFKTFKFRALWMMLKVHGLVRPTLWGSSIQSPKKTSTRPMGQTTQRWTTLDLAACWNTLVACWNINIKSLENQENLHKSKNIFLPGRWRRQHNAGQSSESMDGLTRKIFVGPCVGLNADQWLIRSVSYRQLQRKVETSPYQFLLTSPTSTEHTICQRSIVIYFFSKCCWYFQVRDCIWKRSQSFLWYIKIIGSFPLWIQVNMIEGISHLHLGLFMCSAGYAPKDSDMKSNFSCPKHIFVFQKENITLESDHHQTFFLRISGSEAILFFTPIHQHCFHLRLVSLRMTRAGFLHLTLVLQLLHLSGASTCQGRNCPTGNYYLELNF